MKLSRWILLGMALGLTACASTPQLELRMIPTGDHGVGVRFARGTALMVSNGPSGSVMLLPVRYNDTSKFMFSIAAFNTSDRPINIGSEDVRLHLDGVPYPLQDFDHLRHDARVQAHRDINAAWAAAAVEYLLTAAEYEDHPRQHQIAYRQASGQFYADSAYIHRRLSRTIGILGRSVLQTTTVDPGTTHGGAIVAQQIMVPDGVVQDLVVEVRFGGYPHLFRVALAPSGTYAPTPSDIPAVPAQTTQTLMRTPETWHWTDGPPPPTFMGMPIIE